MGFRFLQLLALLCSACWTLAMVKSEQDSTEQVGSGHYEDSSYFFYEQPKYPRDCSEVFAQCSASNSSGVYVIKPDGFDQPFEVYCDNDGTARGWTVIQRRIDGSVLFDRQWKEYRDGFGFLSHEFWLGNLKLSYLTSQAEYELKIDLSLPNGSTFYVSYNSFRISDEWSQFKLVSLGEYAGNADPFTSFCPSNMVYGDCSCVETCDDPYGQNGCHVGCLGSEGCTCPDGFLMNGSQCVSPSECGCFVEEASAVIPNGGIYINSQCSQKSTCLNGQLLINATYQCDSNAVCQNINDTYRCQCNEQSVGNGETCERTFGNCLEAYNDGNSRSGLYFLKPSDWPHTPFKAYCNMSTDGGGWTVFQRRINGSIDFNRNWTSYKNGFGDLNSEFWLGNEKIHYLTNHGTSNYVLRIDLVTSSYSPVFSKYPTFRIDNEDQKYRVADLGSHQSESTGYDGMSGIAGDSFSTFDRDDDDWPTYNCAERHKGGWWFPESTSSSYSSSACNRWYADGYYRTCTDGNLNGVYDGGNGEGIFWDDSYYCGIKYSEMKIRPTQ